MENSSGEEMCVQKLFFDKEKIEGNREHNTELHRGTTRCDIPQGITRGVWNCVLFKRRDHIQEIFFSLKLIFKIL